MHEGRGGCFGREDGFGNWNDLPSELRSEGSNYKAFVVLDLIVCDARELDVRKKAAAPGPDLLGWEGPWA